MCNLRIEKVDFRAGAAEVSFAYYVRFGLLSLAAEVYFVDYYFVLESYNFRAADAEVFVHYLFDECCRNGPAKVLPKILVSRRRRFSEQGVSDAHL